MSSFQFEQIGVIRSPYKEKFAVPRQPGLVKSANGELHLIAPYNQADAVRGLEAFSHLWIDRGGKLLPHEYRYVAYVRAWSKVHYQSAGRHNRL